MSSEHITAENNTVVVGLSGGVDSSVAALLLKQQGYKVIGLFMKNWEDDDSEEYCSSRQDLVDVMSVADRIGIDVEVVNFAKEYKERVFAEFLKEYQAGRTPNPDVLCNSEIKFRAFLDHAMKMGAGKIATGHYAGVREVPSPTGAGVEYQLLKAEDGTKDQSYFLHRLNQAQLSKTIFPLANVLQARRASHGRGGRPARGGEEGFDRHLLHRRAAVQGVPDALSAGAEGRDPRARLRARARRTRRHDLSHHRPAQGAAHRRHKGGQGADLGEHDAWFVAKKDVAKNILYVVQGHHPALQSEVLHAADLSWISGRTPQPHWVYCAKTRYRQEDAACEVERVDAERCEIRFAAPQWAVTPGQSVVLYESRVCLGGGVIQ